MRATLSRNVAMPASAGQPRRGWTLGRVVALLVGSLLALGSLGLIVGGGYLLAEATRDGGWLSLGHGAYATDGYAVVTEPQDWSNQTYALDNVDKVRIRVTPRDAGTPVFVGLAGPDDVERYLSGVKHVTVHGAANGHVAYTQHDGSEPASPPADAIAWIAQATGPGAQTLEFDAQARSGDLVVVVMNADGSPAVSGRAESTVTQPSLPWLAGGLLAGGAALGVCAAPLIARPAGRARRRR